MASITWGPILLRWRGCVVLPLLALFAFGSAALAQDDQTQERLDRLERDLNMLQRQVYRGSSGAAGETSDPSLAVNTQIRLDRIEQEMRDLTGRIEDAANQINQLRQRVEQVNGDVAARFNEAATQTAAAAAPPPPAEHAQAAPLRASRSAASGMAGTLTPPGTLVPAPAAAAAAAEPPAAAVLPAGSAAEQYNYAFGLLKQADYTAAEQALKAFVMQHRGDVLAGNAQYWLGETYFARGRYIEAAATFAEAYKNYPKGAKAADDLLKLAMSLARARQNSNACLALSQLDHDFPHPGAAIKERAAAAKKQLGC